MKKFQIPIETPIGTLRIISSDTELLGVRFANDLGDIRDLHEGDPTSKVVEQAISFLRSYFRGAREVWKGELTDEGTALQKQIWEYTREIPFGQTISYGELARRIGKPGAARAVGSAMARNPLPILIPCHRVIGSDGSLHGFGGGLDVKRWLLQHEGVEIE